MPVLESVSLLYCSTEEPGNEVDWLQCLFSTALYFIWLFYLLGRRCDRVLGSSHTNLPVEQHVLNY